MFDNDARPGPSADGSRRNFDAQLSGAIESAVEWLVKRQKPEGYWVGQLESNACMEAEWILCLYIIGEEDHHLMPRLAASLVERQRDDGSWDVFYDAPAGDVNTTVEAYAALRAVGFDPDGPELSKARAWILDKGGLRNIRVFTRYWLALIGEWPWEKTPNIPPEVIRFQKWFPFCIYNFAQWARATLMPIAVLSARRPSRPLPADRRLNELFPEGRTSFDYELPKKAGADLWDAFFRVADKILHVLQTAQFTPGRRGAVEQAMGWILTHQDADGVWGGIQPPWIYGVMAMHFENMSHEHPAMRAALGALDDPRWRVDKGDATYIQASVSPVWDTVLTLLAFDDCEQNATQTAAAQRAVQWVLDQQVHLPGDWSVKLPNTTPGGWAFEYANQFYPDTDDTAVALIVLSQFRNHQYWRERGIEGAIDRGVDWLIAMQCQGGGWGAFDKDNDRKIVTKIPFCDFGEALDPPSVDVTAHILEAFGKLGMDATHPSVARGLAYLKAEQEADGAWFGRWGVNYVYGTGAVLPALEAIGEDMSSDYIRNAGDWLLIRQNNDGGWGESCESYMDPNMSGVGPSTASQTAWALMGLAAIGDASHDEAIMRGVAYLMETQSDGTWPEPHYTGTGFPGYGVGQTIKLHDPLLQERLKQGPELSRAFMINYNLYRHYFPLMALGRLRHRLTKDVEPA
ncbi:MAG: squalene--hopene cyclase [Pseudomonadota bacterium]